MLATKEEEKIMAIKRNHELDVASTEAQAKLKELDQHTNWLERRLAQVFSGVVECQPTNCQVDIRFHGRKI